MPDRLQYTLHADPAVLQARCPPTCVLTLVENAVRHGIDPAEDGGRIDVRIEQLPGGVQAAQDVGMVRVRVTDTGLGLGPESSGLGTGLASLRERLQFTFGGQARLVLTGNAPRGTCAEVEFPLQPSRR
jgi:LytS/YehU family sensor histidine kinase